MSVLLQQRVEEVVLIATRYQAVEVYQRTAGGWVFQDYGPGDMVALASVGVDIPVEAAYRRTRVPLVDDMQRARKAV